MKLPDYNSAVFPQAKITEYLLSSVHCERRSKAAFFIRYGFSVEWWEDLAMTLRRHAAEHDVVRIEDSPFGTRYIVEGILAAPDGRAPLIRSVWFIEIGERVPRFVTAYRLSRRLP
jgi:uncharacterized protein DUF6883